MIAKIPFARDALRSCFPGRGVIREARGEDGRGRPLLRRTSRDRRVAGGPQPHGVEEVCALQRPRRDPRGAAMGSAAYYFGQAAINAIPRSAVRGNRDRRAARGPHSSGIGPGPDDASVQGEIEPFPSSNPTRTNGTVAGRFWTVKSATAALTPGVFCLTSVSTVSSKEAFPWLVEPLLSVTIVEKKLKRTRARFAVRIPMRAGLEGRRSGRSCAGDMPGRPAARGGRGPKSVAS